MSFSPKTVLLVPAWLALLCAALQGEQGQPPINVYIRHPLECLLGKDLNIRFFVFNGTDFERTFRGEPADEAGNLALPGDWNLVLEEVKEGKVVSTTDLREAPRAEGELTKLKAQGHRDWRVKLPGKKLPARPGNYRFRVSLAGRETTGRLFRIVETPGPPDWVSLTYTPDKERYFLGESITVRFVMKNNGRDDFHFEEGGDYRGATRHLRYVFTAQNEKGEKAADPKPAQVCMGGMGMSNPHLWPGKTYEKKLPLLAYLRFPSPGKYTVKCYQDLGFGAPQAGLETPGHYRCAFGGTFQIELRVPTQEEATAFLRSLLNERDPSGRRRQFHFLYHPSYLAPLNSLLKQETEKGRLEALVAGVGSIMTVESTKCLIQLAQDGRGEVRVAALRYLSWRLPDPRDTGKAESDSPFRFYSSEARRRDVRSAWDETLRPEVLRSLTKGLQSELPEEVSACAYCLGALGQTDALPLLAGAADRIAPKVPVPKENRRCAEQIASAASLLARLGAAPCKVDQSSSPGRLAVWANMIRTKQEFRTGDWEEILLHMMDLNCPVTRMAAIRWLPEDFSKRDRIPWKELLLEQDQQIWWHAIQVAREAFPEGFRATVMECLGNTTDQHKRDDFSRLLKEIDSRSK